MIPYSRQSTSKADLKAVEAVLKTDWITQGPKIREFEEKLARHVGARFAVAVSSGTAALHIAYLAAGIGEGDEVIIPANTFVATANMVLAVGARPVFCDIDPETLNIDENLIERLITKKTKAIVPVHFAGRACQMDKILRLAKKHGLLVIEDACHALGSSFRGKMIGGLNSDMATFSFHPVKSITTGEGGMVTTNSRDYYERLLLLRSHGIRKDKNGLNEMVMLGFNYRMTDIAAALGVSQLKRISKFIKKRNFLARRYQKKLAGLKNIIIPVKVKDGISSWHLFPIQLSKRLWLKRLEIFSKLRKAGIGVQFHYPPVYSHPYYRKLGYRKGLCPKAEAFSRAEISIPLFPDLSLADQDRVIEELKRLID